MVTREEMARIARRHDTAVARAFLRALLMAPPGGARARAPRPKAPDLRWAGLGECMRNAGRSPLDGPAL